MALEKSEAIILKSFNWSESSRTVVFFSPDHGKLSLIDKGGRAVKSKRGRLLPFCRLDLLYYTSRKEGSGYVSGADLLEFFSLEGDGALGRLAYGSAACELLYHLLPEDQEHRELYAVFVLYLRLIVTVPKAGLPPMFLCFFLRLLSLLGYHPSLGYCSDCSRELVDKKALPGNETAFLFSPERGGIVCSACQKVGQSYIGLSDTETRLLARLQTSSFSTAAQISIGFDEATRMTDAVAQFLRYHAGVGSDLKSLSFLDKLKNSQTK